MTTTTSTTTNQLCSAYFIGYWSNAPTPAPPPREAGGNTGGGGGDRGTGNTGGSGTETNSIDVTTSLTLASFDEWDDAAFLQATQQAAGDSAEYNVEIVSTAFVVGFTMTFPNANGLDEASLKPPIAIANSVAESTVKVTRKSVDRRLSGSARQLTEVEFAVEITSPSVSAAQAVQASAADNDALTAALADAEIAQTPQLSAVVATVVVVTKISGPEGADLEGLSENIQADHCSNLRDTDIEMTECGSEATISTPATTKAAAPPIVATTSGGKRSANMHALMVAAIASVFSATSLAIA